jgi:hypothetical protein
VKIDGVNGACGLNEVELYTSDAGQAVVKKPSVILVLGTPARNVPPSTVFTATVEKVMMDVERVTVPKGKPEPTIHNHPFLKAASD